MFASAIREFGQRVDYASRCGPHSSDQQKRNMPGLPILSYQCLQLIDVHCQFGPLLALDKWHNLQFQLL